MSLQSLETFLAQTKFPEPALAPVKERATKYVEMVNKSNELVAQVGLAKTDNENNAEFLDTIWKGKESDPAIAETVKEFYVVAEAYEKLQAQLRDFAKANMPKSLSEDEIKTARKTVNDMAPTISKAREGLAEMFAMPEGMLKALGVEFPKDGLISLLPNADSLKGSAKGRKAGATGVSYMTRVKDVLIDGKSTAKDGKGKIDYAADALSLRFNFKSVPQNKVTAEEIEVAYWQSLPNSPEPRSIKSTELPNEHTFDFTKEIAVQNGNDDSFKMEPHTVKLTVRNGTFGEAEKAEAPAAPANEGNAEKATTPDAEKDNTEKVESAETEKVPAPAKKVTAKPVAK